jgi:geranylgeranyl diphosphate synthase type II
VAQYEHFLKLFLSHLKQHTDTLTAKKPAELYAPETYILHLGGKRLRPLLALIACDLFDKDESLALDAALAVELFHNFSLIHDDILDEAPLRRNQPTVHKKWNTNIAILSGDVMLVKAFQVLASYPPAAFKALTTLFHRTAIEVCEGQQMDMNFETRQEVTVEEYLEMISRKTAVLLGCSLQMGAIAAGASENDQASLYTFGKHIGIAFQLLDDLLDAFAESDSQFGKQTGGDILANKKTFLLLKSLENADEATRAEIRALLAEKASAAKVEAMLSVFKRLSVKEKCVAEANRHTEKALQCLDELNCSAGKKETLKTFAVGLLSRLH